MDEFEQRFSPRHSLLVGEGGIPLNEFLTVPCPLLVRGSMNMIVPRTCTEIPAENEDQHREKKSRPLKEFRDAPAYVLLGDPGAGKTTAFEAECEALGEDACKIPARNFLAFNPQNHPEWRDKTLFIDGLDEVRAIRRNMVTPFDEIRGRLDSLGKPRFRLSCRASRLAGGQ